MGSFAATVPKVAPAAGFLEGLLVNAEGLVGMSHVRAIFGGAITAIGIMVVIAMITAEITHARVAVIFMFAVIAGRVAGLVLDGFDQKTAVLIAVPVIVFVLLLAAHKLLDKVQEQAAH